MGFLSIVLISVFGSVGGVVPGFLVLGILVGLAFARICAKAVNRGFSAKWADFIADIKRATNTAPWCWRTLPSGPPPFIVTL